MIVEWKLVETHVTIARTDSSIEECINPPNQGKRHFIIERQELPPIMMFWYASMLVLGIFPFCLCSTHRTSFNAAWILWPQVKFDTTRGASSRKYRWLHFRSAWKKSRWQLVTREASKVWSSVEPVLCEREGRAVACKTCFSEHKTATDSLSSLPDNDDNINWWVSNHIMINVLNMSFSIQRKFTWWPQKYDLNVALHCYNQCVSLVKFIHKRYQGFTRSGRTILMSVHTFMLQHRCSLNVD